MMIFSDEWQKQYMYWHTYSQNHIKYKLNRLLISLFFPPRALVYNGREWCTEDLNKNIYIMQVDVLIGTLSFIGFIW